MIEPGEFVSAINSRSLVEAASRHNLDEAHKFYADFRAGKNVPKALFVDSFVDLRQTMVELAKMVDLGICWCLLQDEPSQESAILL